MSNSMMNFTKGIVAGVVVGTTVGMVMRGMSKPSNPFAQIKMKKNAGKMIRNIGTVISHVSGMMK